MPALNTTSTADISFILIIFFLVPTSLDTDRGLMRQMPQLSKDDNVEMVKVDPENVFQIDVDANDVISVDGKVTTLNDIAKAMEKFVAVDPKVHVVSVHVDRESSYDTYFLIQNTIVDVYATLRDRYSQKRYGRPFGKCSREEQEEVRQVIPQRISEQVDVADSNGKGGRQ